jgi:hypothetical protein
MVEPRRASAGGVCRASIVPHAVGSKQQLSGEFIPTARSPGTLANSQWLPVNYQTRHTKLAITPATFSNNAAMATRDHKGFLDCCRAAKATTIPTADPKAEYLNSSTLENRSTQHPTPTTKAAIVSNMSGWRTTRSRGLGVPSGRRGFVHPPSVIPAAGIT